MIYLDYNATTPCDPIVLEAMLPYFHQKFGNASSKTHSYGWVADQAVEQARAETSELIGAEKQEIIFTSGATEACNLAIKGVFERYRAKGQHIITCTTEHSAVLDTCKDLERKGADVTYLPVDENGLINLRDLEAAITDQTILISVMYANNETGVIQPVRQIGEIAKRRQVLFFSDATQAVGKIPVNVREDQIDLLSISAHKMYGPKGVGALYVRRRNPRASLAAQLSGGGHERGIRSGTLNVPGIVGLGKACALWKDISDTGQKKMKALRDHLEKRFLKESFTFVNGIHAKRLPNVSNIAFDGVEAQQLLNALNHDFAFSLGSACSNMIPGASHVLTAMGLPNGRIRSSVRISLGRYTTEEEIETTQKAFIQAAKALRSLKK